MTSFRNDFWLCVHALATAYDAEGLTPDERANNILDQFEEMPAIAQREVLADLFKIMMHSQEIYAQAVSNGEAAAVRQTAVAGNDPRVKGKAG